MCEFWCMRIVVRAPWRRNLPIGIEGANVLVAVKAETYAILPSGNIVEPIEVYDSQAKATERATMEAAKHPGQTYLIVMNADPEALAKAPEASRE